MRSARVAYVVSRFPKLTETFVLFELLTLEAMDIAIELFPLQRERQPTRHPECERWMERAHFQPFLSVPILSAQWHYLRRDARRYLGVLHEVLRRTWGSANFFVGAIAFFPKAVYFAREMERSGITHVHAHFCSHPAFAAFVIHRLTDIPFSFTAHGSDLHVDRRMLDAKVEAAAFAVTISRFNRKVMLDACGELAAHKLHVIHCGVDLEAFSVPSEVRPDGPTRMVCVASFEEVKGHRHLLDACAMLRDRGVEFRCDLVGEGPLRADIERRIARLALDGLVNVLGGRARPDVIRLYQAADLAVLASRPTRQGKREGIPVALMEAMATGLPVVSTAISGIPELVETGRTGILVPPGDARALADALEALAGDPQRRARMGAAGREKVEREFDLRANSAMLLERILASHAGRQVDAIGAGAGLARGDAIERAGEGDVQARGDAVPQGASAGTHASTTR